VGWIKRYIRFHNKRQPKEKGASEVEAFLSSLATQRGVSASTQNQAPMRSGVPLQGRGGLRGPSRLKPLPQRRCATIWATASTIAGDIRPTSGTSGLRR